ncbi:MAG: hypothetical protein OEV35_10180 [Gallionellaceae bacterium]|nr:hypothetical protein [Gallionellaceae bacterium]
MINPQHQTLAEFAARFWERVKFAHQNDKAEFARLITWIWQRVQDGSFTNDQVRQSFNASFGRALTLAQWNSFVTSRLVPIKDRYLAMQAEAEL